MNYATRMRKTIDDYTAGTEYVPRIAAAEIVDKLRAVDPDLLARWLDEQAEHFVWQAINDRDRSLRSRVNRRAGAVQFATAVTQHEQGISNALGPYLNCPYTVADGTRKPLANLTRADLTYVASDYRQRAADNAMRAVVLEKIAAKVKLGTVRDHYTEDQIAAMFSTFDRAA